MGSITVCIDLLFDWFGISCMTTDNFCFHLQNRLIQTSQTGGQQYSDTFPLVFPWSVLGLPLQWMVRLISNFMNSVIYFVLAEVLSNGGICLGINYSVSNEMKRDE